ncbi:MAG: hypothetical protein COA50_04105 [Flavobacteriaceae bacterium]|nr:MAG: hypothetical protein COA50_04105 [Flavobacteriaceae bacterium]
MDIDKAHIKSCLKLIENKLNWGSGENWSTKDFQNLSEKIQEETNVTLSVATLKRIWGKISYTSSPTITTLDALAQFVEFENWRTFEQRQRDESKSQSRKSSRAYSFVPIGSLTKLGVLISLLFLLGWSQFKVPENGLKPLVIEDYQFSSRKMVREGVPNSVIFDYDASSANDRDTIFIQQSWDERLRDQVSKFNKNHSSIYYHPGYFKAKLVVRDTIVNEHDIFIKTKGWLSLADYGNEVPVYFTEEEVLRDDGSLYISEEQMKAKNIPMQPKVPWANYFYMNDMEELNMQNFIFETRFKNTYGKGSGVCQFSYVELRFDSAFIKIPLSIKGCVSQIALFDEDGKNSDPSKLGVDFLDWVTIKLVVKDGLGALYIDDNFVSKLNYSNSYNDLKGIHYAFQGGGQIDEVSIKKINGDVVFEDTF